MRKGECEMINSVEDSLVKSLQELGMSQESMKKLKSFSDDDEQRLILISKIMEIKVQEKTKIRGNLRKEGFIMAVDVVLEVIGFIAENLIRSNKNRGDFKIAVQELLTKATKIMDILKNDIKDSA